MDNLTVHYSDCSEDEFWSEENIQRFQAHYDKLHIEWYQSQGSVGPSDLPPQEPTALEPLGWNDRPLLDASED
jgi:hypothetical protein